MKLYIHKYICNQHRYTWIMQIETAIKREQLSVSMVSFTFKFKYWLVNYESLLWPHVKKSLMLPCRSLKLKAAAAAAAAKSLQSCSTLCDPIDGSPPGSPVPGILQARTLEWVVISFSNAWKWKVKVKSLSHVWLLATPWTAAYQAPPSTLPIHIMGFSRQEYWSGVPLPSPMVQAGSSQNKQSKKKFYTQLLLKLKVKQKEKYSNSMDNSLNHCSWKW